MDVPVDVHFAEPVHRLLFGALVFQFEERLRVTHVPLTKYSWTVNALEAILIAR